MTTVCKQPCQGDRRYIIEVSARSPMIENRRIQVKTVTIVDQPLDYRCSIFEIISISMKEMARVTSGRNLRNIRLALFLVMGSVFKAEHCVQFEVNTFPTPLHVETSGNQVV